MTYANAIAKRTKELLYKRNISQYRLVKDTGLDKSTVQSIFKGKTKDVKFSTIHLIAEFFDMSVIEFLNDEAFSRENLDLL